jgi:hypothetical protein
MRWLRHKARKEEIRNTYTIFVDKPEGKKDQLENLRVDGE